MPAARCCAARWWPKDPAIAASTGNLDDSDLVSTRLIAGHGVASGRSADSPYPNGTIEMQRPFFKALGLDLSRCWPGTLNLSAAPLDLRLRDPDRCFPLVAWTDRHPPETFSFWRIQLDTPKNGIVDGWIATASGNQEASSPAIVDGGGAGTTVGWHCARLPTQSARSA